MNDQKINQFISRINSLSYDNVNDVLRNTYTDQVNFIDPVKSITGLENLTTYFSNLYKQVSHCQFTLSNYIFNDQKVSLEWVMSLQHKKISNNKEILLEGASFIQFSGEKITYHRDYYDLGALVYERIPVLGSVVKKVRHAI